MRLLAFLLSAFFTALLLWALSTSFSIDKRPLPPIGQFFNPFSGFWKNAENKTNTGFKNGETLKLAGLKDKVSVRYDDDAVPHIFAQNLYDAFRVQGYLTAKDRLWQMDITARQTAGRLSEVLGERTLESDRMVRRRGMARAAQTDWDNWKQSDDTRTMFEAYAAGVNDYIHNLSTADLPLEYKLLNFKPEDWTPLKTCLIVESMIDALNNRDNDLASTNARTVFGEATFDYLYPQWFSKQVPVVPDTGQWKKPVQKPLRRQGNALSMHTQEQAPKKLLPFDLQNLNGSNNWAVSGQKTLDGVPFLCNDTHLPLKLPHVWYQVQIHTPNMNAYGVNVPGVPGIVIGFNNDIAWGFTNVSQDVSDWYHIDWTDAEKMHYRLDSTIRTAEIVVENIGIKNHEPLLDTVRYTVFGPVVYDKPDQVLYNYAYRYSTHDAPDPHDMEHFFSIDTGKSYDDYKKAITGLDCLSQNVVFASHSGDIAITVQGRFPIRNPGQARMLQDGSQSANAWHGYVPQDQLPTLKNPGRGFVFSANQHSTSPDFPYYYEGNFDASRARRIFQRLSNMDHVTVDSMKSIQLDNYSMATADALPVMLQLLDRNQLDALDKAYLAELEQWNYQYINTLTAPALYQMWFDSTYALTWDEIDAHNNQGTLMRYPDAWRFTQLMGTDSSSIFFDYTATTQRETARNVVTDGFKKMAGNAKTMNKSQLKWQNFKDFNLRHIARIDAFSRLHLPTDGVRSAPNAIGTDHGPSFRMIVELSDPVKAWGVYPGGQSGNPGSPYYDNMVDAWVKGKYMELVFLQNATDYPKDRIKSSVEFVPKG